jgi:hypothetical protein
MLWDILFIHRHDFDIDLCRKILRGQRCIIGFFYHHLS